MQAWVRPGRDRRNWGDRSSMPAWGLLRTAEDELSVYISQHYRFDSAHLVRATLRLDGFASAHAGYAGGELVTAPIRFQGRRLVLNYATGAAGSVRIELQGQSGAPVPGFALRDAPDLYGDAINETYRWNSGADVSSLAGSPCEFDSSSRTATCTPTGSPGSGQRGADRFPRSGSNRPVWNGPEILHRRGSWERLGLSVQ